MQSLESRRGILIAAGLDALLTQVDLTGAPQEFVADLVNNLSQYGSVAYELALVVFLQEVATQVGEDKQAAMREFLRTVRDESGMLTGWDQEHYGFMHLGFQEYLAPVRFRTGRHLRN